MKRFSFAVMVSLMMILAITSPVKCWHFEQFAPLPGVRDVTANNTGQIYARTHDAILLLQNGAWEQILDLTGLYCSDGAKLISVDEDHLTMACWYVDTVTNVAYIKTTTDRGQTWHTTDITQYLDGFTNFVQLSNDDLVVLSSTGSDATMFRSDDSGVTWEAFSGIPLWDVEGGLRVMNDDVLVMGGGEAHPDETHRIYISSDEGLTWTPSEPDPDITGIDSILTLENTIHVMATRNMYLQSYYFSPDGGATWELREEYEPFIDRHRFLGQTADGHIYRKGPGIAVSRDNGLTWEQMTTIPWGAICSDFATINQDTVIVCAERVSGNMVYRSTDAKNGYMETVFQRISGSPVIPDAHYRPGDFFSLDALVYNKTDSDITDAMFFVVLEAYGAIFFAPSWSDFDYFGWTFPPGETTVPILPEFRWPGGVDEGNAAFMAGMFGGELLSNIYTWEFTWGP